MVAETELPREIVEPFLVEAIARATPLGVGGLGELALLLVSRFRYGHAAAENAVRRPDMPDWGHLLMHQVAKQFEDRETVHWWHDLFAQYVKRDSLYEGFLAAHATELLAHKYVEVARYLLVPDRGPGHCNVDSMVKVVCTTDQPGPFVQRWVGWLWDGRFDHTEGDGNELPHLHYACIIDGLREAPGPVGPVLDQTLLWVKTCLHSSDAATFDAGCRHLLAMLEREVPFASRVKVQVLHDVAWTDGPRRAGRFGLAIEAAFDQLVGEVEPTTSKRSEAFHARIRAACAEFERLTAS
jgi:hypothetical protein